MGKPKIEESLVTPSLGPRLGTILIRTLPFSRFASIAALLVYYKKLLAPQVILYVMQSRLDQLGLQIC